MSKATKFWGTIGILVVVPVVFFLFSLGRGGQMPGPTHIDPGNVGLVVNVVKGQVEPNVTGAGTDWTNTEEHLYEVPTAQQTLSMAQGDKNENGDPAPDPIQVNTESNMLGVDVTAQYHIVADKATSLYNAYQDQFTDLNAFEDIQLIPSVKEAINYGLGDEETALSLTTAGKQQAEAYGLKALNDEWGPKGIVFDTLMIRAIHPDDATNQLLASTVQKQQDIQNAKIQVQQQQIENQTTIQAAEAEAKINNLQNSTLTDLYIQDQLLGKVHKLYIPSGQLLDLLKK